MTSLRSASGVSPTPDDPAKGIAPIGGDEGNGGGGANG